MHKLRRIQMHIHARGMYSVMSQVSTLRRTCVAAADVRLWHLLAIKDRGPLTFLFRKVFGRWPMER